jgi:sugar phosphate isomerase/epimerase
MATITAISSLAWAHYTLDEAISQISATGFRRMEIASFPVNCPHFNFGGPSPDELRQKLESRGLTPICLNFWGGPRWAWAEDDIEQFIEVSRRKIDHCRQVGIPMMALHFAYYNERPDIDAQYHRAAHAYETVAHIAADNGVAAVVELPHMHSLYRDASSVLRLIERVKSADLGVVLDSSHWGVIDYDLEGFLSRLGDRLKHVHLRDSRRHGETPDECDLELTPGKGTVDFRKLADALDDSGYDGDVSLEFEYHDIPFGTIRREIDQGIGFLTATGWKIAL